MTKNSIRHYSVSVIVPARDEAGTVDELVKRLPKLGRKTELVFVEGFSKDGTWKKIGEIIKDNKKNKKRKFEIKAYKQGRVKGKGCAVDVGFSKAKGDILMILDADLTVRPEDLPLFYRAFLSGSHFVNGSRFVYPKEAGAMRYLNNTGNIFFSKVFSLMLGQKVTDTLCGSKALFRKDYKKIVGVTKEFAHDDPYGDFKLFLGASLLDLPIKEVPVKYFARVYGKTKISRFRDGFKLLNILFKAVGVFISCGKVFRI